MRSSSSRTGIPSVSARCWALKRSPTTRYMTSWRGSRLAQPSKKRWSWPASIRHARAPCCWSSHPRPSATCWNSLWILWWTAAAREVDRAKPVDEQQTLGATKPELRARFEAAGGKPVYVRRMFGRIARVYDAMNRIMSLGLDGRWRRFTVRHIALGPNESGLDIGTGTGDLAIELARVSTPSAHVVGVDFTPEMLDRGRAKIKRLGLSDRVELRQGDGEHLDFPDNSFDACC